MGTNYNISEVKSIIDFNNGNISFEHITDGMMILNNRETDVFWPLKNHYCDFLYKIDEFFKKIHKKIKIYYVVSDNYAHKKIEKWKELVNPIIEIEILIYPFIMSCVYNRYDLFDNTITIDNQNITYKKKYNVISLVSNPKIIRLLLLDQLYSYDNFVYSYNPFPHMNKYDYEKNKPVIINWSGDDSVSLNNNHIYVNLAADFSNSNIFPNGFDSKKNIKLLEEIDSFIGNDLIDYDIFEHNVKKFISDEKYVPSKIHITEEQKTIFNNSVPIEYLTSNIDLVCESYVNDSILITEKTWKPLLFGKVFIILGPVNIHKTIRDMGFYLYDEIFDYSFDSEKNIKKRFEKIIYQIKELLEQDIQDLHEKIIKIQQKVSFNKTKFISIRETEKSYIKEKYKFKNLYYRQNEFTND